MRLGLSFEVYDRKFSRVEKRFHPFKGQNWELVNLKIPVLKVFNFLFIVLLIYCSKPIFIHFFDLRVT